MTVGNRDSAEQAFAQDAAVPTFKAQLGMQEHVLTMDAAETQEQLQELAEPLSPRAEELAPAEGAKDAAGPDAAAAAVLAPANNAEDPAGPDPADAEVLAPATSAEAAASPDAAEAEGSIPPESTFEVPLQEPGHEEIPSQADSFWTHDSPRVVVALTQVSAADADTPAGRTDAPGDQISSHKPLQEETAMNEQTHLQQAEDVVA